MRASVHGPGAELERAIAAAFRARGHEVGEPAEVVVVGFDVADGRDLLQTGHDDWESAIASVRAAFFAMQRAAQSLVERGVPGHIIAVAPVHLIRPSRGCGLAAVAGSFLATAAQVAAVELGTNGIRVNVLAVGPLESDAPARTADAVPLGRLAHPDDIASACVMLASPEAAFVSGAVIAVDGGYAITKGTGGSPFATGA